MDTGHFAHDLQQVIYYASKVLLYPVLIAALVCLVWVVLELGRFIQELFLRLRYRDLEALEASTLSAREAFANGQPRRAYRYLQENNYSMVVVRFLYELIRNYQTERLAEKPLKLLQEYEFYTIKRLERTRILVRLGPILGLMGTLIPLSPALKALADNDTQKFADNLTIAFSVTVIGLLIGGLAFLITMVRDRIYSQDISDLEYLLELLEGNAPRLHAGIDTHPKGVDGEDEDEGDVVENEAAEGEMAAGDVGPDEGVTSAETVLIEPADGLVISPAPPRDMPAAAAPEDAEERAAGEAVAGDVAGADEDESAGEAVAGDENAAGGEAAADDVAAADGGEPVAGDVPAAPEEDPAEAPASRRRTSKKR